MKTTLSIFTTLWNHRLRLPLLVLAFASAVSCGLLAGRILYTGHGRQLYLAWNLLLAWMPLLFALTVVSLPTSPGSSRWHLGAAALAWLFFFPNAPYILTDLVHLGPRGPGLFWVDLVLIVMFGLTGFVLGFLSLYLMQQLVAQRLGRAMGWLFVVGVATLSGFGICVGRFLRWNSWDVVLNPIDLLADMFRWITLMPVDLKSAALPVLFATLLFVVYLMLYALTHLPKTQHLEGEAQTSRAIHPGRAL
jgi:uncharacterized membrane protein